MPQDRIAGGGTGPGTAMAGRATETMKRAGDMAEQAYATGRRAVRAGGRQADGNTLVALGAGIAIGCLISYVAAAGRPRPTDWIRGRLEEPRRGPDLLIAWLKDAHAMEAATVDNQARQVRHLADYPELQAKFQQHLAESRQHVARLEQCLTQLGADTSLLKDLAMQITSRVEALVAGVTPDEVVKTCLAAQAYEAFEIASYRSLIAAAEECDLPEIKRLCEDNLRDEQAMATWLEGRVSEVTRQYLQRSAQAGSVRLGH